MSITHQVDIPLQIPSELSAFLESLEGTPAEVRAQIRAKAREYRAEGLNTVRRRLFTGLRGRGRG